MPSLGKNDLADPQVQYIIESLQQQSDDEILALFLGELEKIDHDLLIRFLPGAIETLSGRGQAVVSFWRPLSEPVEHELSSDMVFAALVDIIMGREQLRQQTKEALVSIKLTIE